MRIWQTGKQFYSDGKRISRALFDEIKARAEERDDLRDDVKWFWITGMTANVYTGETQAGKVDWSEQLLRAGS